jgi:hypothetical protein
VKIFDISSLHVSFTIYGFLSRFLILNLVANCSGSWNSVTIRFLQDFVVSSGKKSEYLQDPYCICQGSSAKIPRIFARATSATSLFVFQYRDLGMWQFKLIVTGADHQLSHFSCSKELLNRSTCFKERWWEPTPKGIWNDENKIISYQFTTACRILGFLFF